MSDVAPAPPEEPQNIATAIADVTERATLLIREEIELAKAEVTEKATKLVKGTVVALAAGVFVLVAIAVALEGLAWLIWWALGTDEPNYFLGFFILAGLLLVLAVIAGVIAAKVVKAGSPPVPKMAIDEARKIRETVGAPAGASAPPPVSTNGSPPASAPVPPPAGHASSSPGPPAPPLSPPPAAPKAPPPPFRAAPPPSAVARPAGSSPPAAQPPRQAPPRNEPARGAAQPAPTFAPPPIPPPAPFAPAGPGAGERRSDEPGEGRP